MKEDPAILDRFRTLLREHDRRTIERCATVAQEEARRLGAERHEIGNAILLATVDVINTAAVARRIEAAIRALAEGGEHG